LTDFGGSGIQSVLIAASKERAAVLLKDVLQYRLAAVAEVADSTVGGVKEHCIELGPSFARRTRPMVEVAGSFCLVRMTVHR
jgi:hypothetical protein